MRLEPGDTTIALEEYVADDGSFADRRFISAGWRATLDGTVNGAFITMSRNGGTPDEALKNLFEAMHDADVTL